jgi:hypothetical protein
MRPIRASAAGDLNHLVSRNLRDLSMSFLATPGTESTPLGLTVPPVKLAIHFFSFEVKQTRPTVRSAKQRN